MLESIWLHIFPSSKHRHYVTGMFVSVSLTQTGFGLEKEEECFTQFMGVYGIVIFKLENNTDNLW